VRIVNGRGSKLQNDFGWLVLWCFIWLNKFYAIFTSPKQILLDRGIWLVVFGANCDRMVVGFITIYAISAYHHWWRYSEDC
jgi:hypothetical protein